MQSACSFCGRASSHYYCDQTITLIWCGYCRVNDQKCAICKLPLAGAHPECERRAALRDVDTPAIVEGRRC